MDDDEVLEEENIEDALADLPKIADWSQGAVLWSTDWTAETILSQLSRFNIDLDPTFQRRSAWNLKKQSLFIESLILGLPIPQLILAEAPGKRGSFIVIDGKQRLLAIRRFGVRENKVEFPMLRLRGLNELRRLNGKSYHDLCSELDLSDDRAAFENSSIRTIIIRNWKHEEYLYEVFLRINTGSVQLSPQELRQALHPGPFSTLVSEASADSQELQMALGIRVPDFRMRDAEILLRFIAYKFFISDYNGNLKYFLDETTRRMNQNWAEMSEAVAEAIAKMEAAFTFTRQVFGDRFYLRKWNGEQFESRKNRAVFDIMLHFFSEEHVRLSLVGKEEAIVSKFKNLCENEIFRTAIETTTKSMESNRVRFNFWGSVVEELSEMDLSHLKFPVPANVEGV